MNPLLFSPYSLFLPWQNTSPLDLDSSALPDSNFLTSNWLDDPLPEGRDSGFNPIFSNSFFSNPLFSNSLFTPNFSTPFDMEEQTSETTLASNTFSPLSQMFSGFDFSLLSTPLNSQSVTSPAAARSERTDTTTRNSLTDLLNTSQQDSVYSSLLSSFNDLFSTVNQIAALKK